MRTRPIESRRLALARRKSAHVRDDTYGRLDWDGGNAVAKCLARLALLTGGRYRQVRLPPPLHTAVKMGDICEL